MNRKINDFLLKWKNDPKRRPLVLYGSKQVGKTYSSIEFGKNNYNNTVYVDTYNNTEFIELVTKEKTLDTIANAIAKYTEEIVEKNNTLIILDNVNSVDLVNSIKSFGKFNNDYHIIMITSLKENLTRFKGIELQFKSVLPMDFEEYLMAHDKYDLIEFIKVSFKNNSKNPFHQLAMEYFDNFIRTGGMPEAVNLSINSDNILLLNSVYDKIIDTYKKEIALQDNLIDIVRSNEVYDSVSVQLRKENKKFQYGLLKSGGRAKEYENALNFLHTNGFIYKSYKILEVKSPLFSNKDKDSFKVYYNDCGLLYKKYALNFNKLNEEYKEILYENSVAASLVSSGYTLEYYTSKGKAEIDFVIQTKAGNIVPIELVPHIKTKSKALGLFMEQYNINEAFRITRDNFYKKNNVRYIPVYATFCLSDLI